MTFSLRFLKWITILVILLFASCNPYKRITKFERSITFSGMEWLVKSASEPVGPGPNWFDDSPDNVWVDSFGNLHLRVRKEDDKWTCAEVVSKDELGYGKYFFQVIGQLDELDPELVLGLFTWSNRGPHNREVDIEFSKWGDQGAGYNAQYVIQPAYVRGHRYRFPIRQEGSYTTHQFSWFPGFVSFNSYHGHVFDNNQEATPIKFWVYPRRIGKPRRVHVRMNLWLFNGELPDREKDFELVIKRFRYEPMV
ncbi:MAG: hypothetical protein J7L96_03685 [Bacteroidales bacterium]|nr:hypothetical protein [Bacteroidales bacterium]